MDDFKRRMVKLANKTQEHLSGDFAQVREIVDIFAKSPSRCSGRDVREPDGVGLLSH